MKSDYNQKGDGYFAEARPDIQQFIRNDIETLLDVGCGAGEMASQLKNKNRIKDVWGIELVESAGRKAEQVLDKVIISPVEKAIDQLPNNYFDTIIFADVLEHLIEPQEVLSKILSKLKEGGEIIASIPNIRHWSIIKMLLEGNWQYAQYGLLDRTHLRFFTKNSINELFASAGFSAEFLGSSKVAQIEVSDQIIDNLIQNGINAQTLQAEINDFQYFVRGKKNGKAVQISILNEKALVIPIEIISNDLIKKVTSLSNEAKKNLKIIFLYEVKNEVVDFIINLEKNDNSVQAVLRENFKHEKYIEVFEIKNENFDKDELELKLTQIRQ